MSLLMEALKKAEEAKRLAGESNAPAATPIAVSELTLQEMTPFNVFTPFVDIAAA